MKLFKYCHIKNTVFAIGLAVALTGAMGSGTYAHELGTNPNPSGADDLFSSSYSNEDQDDGNKDEDKTPKTVETTTYTTTLPDGTKKTWTTEKTTSQKTYPEDPSNGTDGMNDLGDGVDSSDIDTTPISTNEFIMVGGDWITPTAVYGQNVNVVLPIVNMSVTNLYDVIVTPVIASDSKEWPFEIQTSGYTQKVPDLPGKYNGQNDMDRRRELTWTFKTRADVLNGYYKLPFDIIYYTGESYEKATITTWVKVVGAPGAGQLSDGGSAISTPRVIITGFDTEPKNVYAGDTFTLTLHLKNTSKRTAVSNMQVDLSTPSAGTDAATTYEAFLPTSGSNTLYVERIGANSTSDISIEMTAKSDLSQKPYAIAVNMAYEDDNYAAFTAKADVSIPVNQDAKFDISSMEVMPSDITVGGQSNVMFSIYNTGKTTLYNVQVKFKGDSVSGGDCFIGKIDPGGTGNVDAMVEGVAATMDDGTVYAVISYENEAGVVTEKEEPLTIFVTEEFYEDEMAYDDMMYEETSGSKTGLIIVIIIVVVIAISVAAVIILRKRKKKKEQKELEEELEEDLDKDLDSEEQDEIS